MSAKGAKAKKSKVVAKTKKKTTLKSAAQKLSKKVAQHIKKALKPSPVKAVPAKKPAAAAAPAKKAKPTINLVDAFFQNWKPKNESLEVGLDKAFQKAEIPEKERGPYRADLIEKIRIQLRKNPMTPEIEELLAERFPRDRVRRLGSIFSLKPKATIRLNVLRADIRGFAESLLAKSIKAQLSQLSPFGFEVGDVELASRPENLQRGLYEFQDEASQLITIIANARPGMRVLDMCAGRGEKAITLGMLMKNKGSLFIYNSDGKDLKDFREKAARATLDNYRILTDSQIAEVKSLDVVVVEAPSSALGQLASRPEIKSRFHRDELAKIQKLQAALLREGARKLKLGGHLVYATKTLSRSENENQIEHFLRTSHNSYRVISLGQYLKESILPILENFYGFKVDEKLFTQMTESDPFISLAPDVHGCEGTFIALLQRTRIST